MKYLDSSAVVDGEYRYQLRRQWADGPRAVWIMLNPSTADDQEDDPTIRRVVSFSARWGFGQMEVVNLFALRVSRPLHLAEYEDPVGPLNFMYLREAIMHHEMLIAAWGGSGDYARRYVQAQALSSLVNQQRKRLMCLGNTKTGDPRHPLYVKGDTRLEVYR